MTLARYLVPFILMAIATATILTVGVFGAADLLHRPRRRSGAREGQRAPEVSRLSTPTAGDPSSDHDDPPHGRAA